MFHHFNVSMLAVAGFAKEVSTIHLSMAQMDSNMQSMSAQMVEMKKSQGDMRGRLDKVVSTAANDHDITQSLQVCLSVCLSDGYMEKCGDLNP